MNNTVEVSCIGICALNQHLICTGCNRTLKQIENEGLWLQRIILLQSAKNIVKAIV
jgi:predicted Fe-S protein YdhL (DUF1289 family)